MQHSPSINGSGPPIPSWAYPFYPPPCKCELTKQIRFFNHKTREFYYHPPPPPMAADARTVPCPYDVDSATGAPCGALESKFSREKNIK